MTLDQAERRYRRALGLYRADCEAIERECPSFLQPDARSASWVRTGCRDARAAYREALRLDGVERTEEAA